MPKFKALYFFLFLPFLCVFTAFNLDFKTDISTFFMVGDKAEEQGLANEIQSGTLSKRYILSIGSPKTIPNKQFIDALTHDFKRIEGVNDVWISNETQGIITSVSSIYRHYGTQLYSRDPQHDLPLIFTPENLQRRAEGLKMGLLSPQSGFIKKILKYDPLLLSLTGFKNLSKQFNHRFKQNQHYQSLILETKNSGTDFNHQLSVQEHIQAIFNQHKKNNNESLVLEMTGVPVFSVSIQKRMQNEITLISILSSIALTVLFFILFRSFKVLFWIASLLIAVICCALLMTQLIFGFVHGMTIAIGTTLVGICIDYPIHALVHGQAFSLKKRLSILKKIFPSLLLGAITTLIGYFALGLSGYPGFQQVAVYTSTGILVSLVLTRYLLPYLINGIELKSVQFKLATLWLIACQRWHKPLLILLILVSFGSLYLLDRLTWMQDLQELTPELNALKATDKKIRDRMISIEPGRFIMVKGISLEQVLQRSEQVYLQLDQLKQQHHLTDYFGLYPWLLSKQQQQLNSYLFHKAFTEETLKQWQSALKSQGLSVDRLGRLNYSQTDSLSLDHLLKTPLKRLLKHQIIQHKQQFFLMIWLGEHNTTVLEKLFLSNDEAHYFSQRDMLNNMAIKYQQRAQLMLLAGLSIIALLLIFRYKSLKKALITLAPACLSALIILGLWALQGVSISFLHLVGFLLVIAICVDYGIFFQENRGKNIHLTYQAMTASMLTSALTFGCLIMAETTTLKILAQVVTSGIILGFLFCPLIIRHKT
ncbi:MAG: MMPL family transporter [Methylococcales bacterium]|nr:MMPL family transporter [Methylococcales bacterium]